MLEVRTHSQLLSLQLPPAKFLVEPRILASGGSMFVYGAADTFKSWLTIDLMYSLAQGKPWLMFNTKPARSLVIQAEQTELMYRERIVTYTKARLAGVTFDPETIPHFATEVNIELDAYTGQGLVEKAIADSRPDVVVLDNLYRMISGSTVDDASLARVLRFIAMIQRDYGCAFVIVHHTRKENIERGDGGFEDMVGSSILSRWPDTILKVAHADPKAHELLKFQFQKLKNATAPIPDFAQRWDSGKVKFVHATLDDGKDDKEE